MRCEMKIYKKECVSGGDTYEIAYAHSYPENHWSEDSLYFPDDEHGIGFLSKYFDEVFPEYAYFAPQKIRVDEWAKVEAKCLYKNKENESAIHFFEAVRAWLPGNRGADHFWILGI